LRAIQKNRYSRVSSDVELNPRPGITTIVYVIVNQTCMASQRDSAACGFEVSLGSDRVLLIAQMIALVGDEFGERYA
jgi:hypothetical protein